MPTQGPVTLILDSATDAPAPPKAKTPLTAEQKERAKAKVAARQERAKQQRPNGSATVDAAASEPNVAATAPAIGSGVAALSEDRLISEAEEKSRELAESFKIAMTESYP